MNKKRYQKAAVITNCILAMLTAQISFAQELLTSGKSNIYYANDGKSNSLTLDKPINSNAAAAIEGTTDYQAYGVHLNGLKTNVATNFSYNGEYQDPASDLVYLRARDYDAGTQRFIAQDSANVWNKYNFADSNPIMNIDPSGHMPAWLNYTLNGLGIAGAIVAGVASGGAAVPLIAAGLGGASGVAGIVAQAAGNNTDLQTASLVLGLASMGFDVASGISSAAGRAGGAGEIRAPQLFDGEVQESTVAHLSSVRSAEVTSHIPVSYNYSPQRLNDTNLARLNEFLNHQNISEEGWSNIVESNYGTYNVYDYNQVVPSIRETMTHVDNWLTNNMGALSGEQIVMLECRKTKNSLLYDFTEQAFLRKWIQYHVDRQTQFIEICAFNSAKSFPQLRALVLGYENPLNYSLIDFDYISLDGAV
ncbi:RHS repeat-associated core domain-containing protein [Cysteiniphilum sp. 6C5]|uniref:RHS repeat-associated core domain-containing protein n=1 Tax=unclassified Cysteiniphilum TaxID=2610889 RepID=UPI003F82D12C